MSFNIATINPFVNETKAQLINKAVLTGKTMEFATVIPGIKYAEKCPWIDNEITVELATCGFTSNGNLQIFQREVVVTPQEVKEQLCEKDLEKIFLGQTFKPGAPKDMELGPIIAESYVNKIKKSNEMNLWQGNAPASAYTTFNGYITWLTNDGTYIPCVAAAGPHTAATIVAHVDAMIALIPQDIMEKNDLILAMSMQNFLLYSSALVNANLFHYDGNVDLNWEINVPGKPIKVMGIVGLQGRAEMVLTFGENLIVGTDMTNEEEKFNIWYSVDFDAVRVNIQWKLGASVYFPDWTVCNF